MADRPEGPSSASNPWVGVSGIPAHPNSPAGGGGPGFFTSGGSLGTPGNDSDLVPHPSSPVGRNHELGQDDIDRLHEGGVQLDNTVKVTDNTPKRNPPPKVTPETFKITRSNAFEDIDITIKILADGKLSDPTRSKQAHTDVNLSNDKVLQPDFTVDAKGKVDGIGKLGPDKKTIVDPNLKLTLKGTVSIQILYGSDAPADGPSLYGRGTTTSDVANKDTTLGFHEHCHVQDLRAYFKDTTKLPEIFTGKKGDSEKSFEAAQEKWLAKANNYFSKASEDSKNSTDETGSPTLAAYITANPGYKH